MKFHHSLLVLIATVFIFSCNIIDNGEKGNGNVIKTTRNVAAFNKLSIDGVFHVFISQGEKENIEIEGDENLIPFITTEVNNGELKLDIQKGKSFSKVTKMDIHVTLKNIDALNIEGVNEVTSDSLKFQNLILNCNGVGSTELNMNVAVLNAKLDGVGKTTLVGNADSAHLENSGVGTIHAYDFVVQKLDVKNDGVGNIEANANQKIYLNNTGVGSIKHKGNATIKASNNDGVGKIKKVD